MNNNEIKILKASLSDEVILYCKDNENRLSAPCLSKESIESLIKELQEAIK